MLPALRPGQVIPEGRSANTKVHSRRSVVDGVELHWTERGEGSVVVILHGLGDSQHTWATVATRLATRYRVLCLDLPGCGRSGRPDAAYGIDWQARLVAAWLDHLGIEQHDVIGHSYGGGVALWLLLHRASAVRKMALVAPGGLGVEVTPLLRLAALFGLFELSGQQLIGPITRLLLRRYGGSLTALQRRELCEMNATIGTARAFGRTVRDVIDWRRGQTRQLLQHVDRLRQLPSMALFWGERDRVIPVHHGEALRALLENCSLCRLPGGHFLHWQAPEALAAAVSGYLGEPLVQPVRLRKRCPVGSDRGRRMPSVVRA
jgi:pimeloyl-ACP methyl ester carboxylesterase